MIKMIRELKMLNIHWQITSVRLL